MPHRKVPSHEAGIEEEQELLAVELVREAGGQNAGDAGAKGVGGDRQAELAGADVQGRHEMAPRGLMIMKSSTTVNCRKASMAMTNFW